MGTYEMQNKNNTPQLYKLIGQDYFLHFNPNGNWMVKANAKYKYKLKYTSIIAFEVCSSLYLTLAILLE